MLTTVFVGSIVVSISYALETRYDTLIRAIFQHVCSLRSLELQGEVRQTDNKKGHLCR